MRFILKEYLSSLKEDGQLDTSVRELLLAMKFLPLTTTQKGRQYGVDISAVGIDDDNLEKLFLFVIKQGNFSRKSWDSGNPTDIRPSINEIMDVYINTRIAKPYNELPIKIVVCCNGEMEQPVEQNWAQFVNKHTTPGKLAFDFWGLYHLVEKTEQFQVSEDLMTPDLALNFRRSLAFIDLPDYDLGHFTKFLTQLLPSKEPVALTEKQAQRKIRLANLAMSIIHNWCSKANNTKPSYVAGERIVLTTFHWLQANDLLKKSALIGDYYVLIQNWRQINFDYIEKTSEFFTVSEGLGLGIASHDEYCLITFEQIGIVSMMGLLEVWEFYLANAQADVSSLERTSYSYENATGYANILAIIIKNNPSSLNPRYDEHCIEINLGLILLFEAGLYGPAVTWLRDLVDRMVLNVKMAKFYPLLHTNPENLRTEKG